MFNIIVVQFDNQLIIKQHHMHVNNDQK